MPPKKNPANKNQKILQLYGILMFSGVEHSLGELARRLRCSKQSVLRYIDDIEMSAKGELIRWTGGDGQAYYKMKAPPVKPRVSLSPEDIQHLLMCHDLLTHLLPRGMMEEVTDIIGHTTVLLDDFNEREKGFQSLFGVKPFGGNIDSTPQEEIIAVLKKGIDQKKICTVSYESQVQRDPVQLSAAPLKIFSYRGALYLKVRKMDWKDEGLVQLSIGRTIGFFVPTPAQLEILAVHRMLGAVLTDEDFVPDFVKETENDTFGLKLEEPFQVKVAFSPLVSGYIKKRLWSSKQKIEKNNDGGVTLTFQAGNRDEVLSWIMSFGTQARVVEPGELQDKILSLSMDLCKQYETVRYFKNNEQEEDVEQEKASASEEEGESLSLEEMLLFSVEDELCLDLDDSEDDESS